MTSTFISTRLHRRGLAIADREPGPEFSIVAPIHNEELVLPELYRRVRSVLEGVTDSWELILVDDGSHDRSADWIEQLCRADEHVRGLCLARNFGFSAAVTAGLEESRGRAVILMDGDLQDPPEVIPEMIARWRAGYEVVYGVRRRREGETWFKRASAFAFYRVLRILTNVDIPVDTGDFRLIDRRVVDTLCRMPERHRFLRGMVSWTGFRQIGISYERKPRFAGQTSFTMGRMIQFALDAITGFTCRPLRWAGYLGAALCAGACLAAMGGTAAWLLGSTLLSLGEMIALPALLLVGGIQLLCLGIAGEYLGRMYEEIQCRPLFLVSERWGFDSQTWM